MAYLFRIAAGLLLVLSFGMIWTPAYASFPATQTNTSECTVAPCYAFNSPSIYTGAASGLQSSPQTACSVAAANYNAQGSTYELRNIRVTAGGSDGLCTVDVYYRSSGAYGTSNSYTIQRVSVAPASPVYGCPSNATLAGSSCTCNSGYLQDGNACVSQQAVDDAACKNLAAGLNLVGAPMVHYGSAGLTACFGGYVMSGTGSASGGGQTELYGPFKCTGANASTCSVVPKPADITANCAAGSYPGTVNGVQVCVPPSTSVEAPKTTTSTPPAGGGPAPEIPGAPAGTTTEEKKTECEGPSCTTTTTYKDSAGVPTGTKTETESKVSHCAANPNAPGCESLEASTFGGNCSGGFTFKGDAIQGALAKEVYKQNCIINDTSDESSLYATKKAIGEGDLTSTLPGNQTVSVGSGDFDASDAIGGAACITNKTVVVWGKSIVLPFSDVCPAMGYLKTILLAVSWLSAAGIVIGRKT